MALLLLLLAPHVSALTVAVLALVVLVLVAMADTPCTRLRQRRSDPIAPDRAARTSVAEGGPAAAAC